MWPQTIKKTDLTPQKRTTWNKTETGRGGEEGETLQIKNKLHTHSPGKRGHQRERLRESERATVRRRLNSKGAGSVSEKAPMAENGGSFISLQPSSKEAAEWVSEWVRKRGREHEKGRKRMSEERERESTKSAGCGQAEHTLTRGAMSPCQTRETRWLAEILFVVVHFYKWWKYWFKNKNLNRAQDF